MKNFVKRKPYGGQRKINSSRSGVADSPYLQANGNSNGFKRNGKNPKDQYNDYLNKAKDAKGQGDDVLEQFYLQHAEHYFRQTDNSNRGFVARKIINNSLYSTSRIFRISKLYFLIVFKNFFNSLFDFFWFIFFIKFYFVFIV